MSLRSSVEFLSKEFPDQEIEALEDVLRACSNDRDTALAALREMLRPNDQRPMPAELSSDSASSMSSSSSDSSLAGLSTASIVPRAFDNSDLEILAMPESPQNRRQPSLSSSSSAVSSNALSSQETGTSSSLRDSRSGPRSSGYEQSNTFTFHIDEAELLLCSARNGNHGLLLHHDELAVMQRSETVDTDVSLSAIPNGFWCFLGVRQSKTTQCKCATLHDTAQPILAPLWALESDTSSGSRYTYTSSSVSSGKRFVITVVRFMDGVVSVHRRTIAKDYTGEIEPRLVPHGAQVLVAFPAYILVFDPSVMKVVAKTVVPRAATNPCVLNRTVFQYTNDDHLILRRQAAQYRFRCMTDTMSFSSTYQPQRLAVSSGWAIVCRVGAGISGHLQLLFFPLHEIEADIAASEHKPSYTYQAQAQVVPFDGCRSLPQHLIVLQQTEAEVRLVLVYEASDSDDKGVQISAMSFTPAEHSWMPISTVEAERETYAVFQGIGSSLLVSLFAVSRGFWPSSERPRVNEPLSSYSVPIRSKTQQPPPPKKQYGLPSITEFEDGREVAVWRPNKTSLLLGATSALTANKTFVRGPYLLLLLLLLLVDSFVHRLTNDDSRAELRDGRAQVRRALSDRRASSGRSPAAVRFTRHQVRPCVHHYVSSPNQAAQPGHGRGTGRLSQELMRCGSVVPSRLLFRYCTHCRYT